MDVVRRRLGMSEIETRSSEDKLNSSKILSTWYTMKYGKTLFSLDSSPVFTVNSPVWLLGVCYHRRMRQTLHSVNQVCRLSYSTFNFFKTGVGLGGPEFLRCSEICLLKTASRKVIIISPNSYTDIIQNKAD